MKSFFRTKLFLLGFLTLLLNGCSTEELVSHHHQHAETNKNKISFSDFKKITNQKGDLTLKLPLQGANTSGKASSLNEFVIDTVTIMQLVNANNKTTYSFRVYPTASIPLQNQNYNLVFNKENNVWHKTLLYFEDNQVLNNKKLENFENLYQSNPNSTMSSGGICTNTHSYIECDGSCASAGYSSCDGFACSTGQCIKTVSTIVACDGGGGGPTDPNGNSTPNGGSGYNPEDPFSFIPNIYDNPVFDDANYVNTIKATHFFNNLQYAGKVWASENAETYLSLIQYQIQNNWSTASTAFANEVMDILRPLSIDCEESWYLLEVTKATLYAKDNNYFNTNLDSNFFNAVNTNSIDPQSVINFARVFLAHCAVLKKENPSWSGTEIFVTAYFDTLHLLLDFAGLVPVIGEIADLTNGSIYLIQGQGVNASLSFASAIPIAGWASAGVKFAKRADGLRFLIVGANNLVHFGAANSKKFRAACGILAGDVTKQAHHIIPRGSDLLKHEVVQRATQVATNQGFHIDSALNGIAVATWRNQPNHHAYNNLIKTKLTNFINATPNATPQQCYNQLMLILNQAKAAIINNPNVHINNLIF